MLASDIETAFADGARPVWAPGLHVVSDPSFFGIEDWLARSAYAWHSAAPGAFSLHHPVTDPSLTEALASEVARFSCAAFESFFDAAAIPPAQRALSWQLIQRYYAAFYSAHAIIRATGDALTFLSSKTTSQLNATGSQYLGASPGVSKGLHHIHRDEANPSIVRLTRVSAGGGSHEDMWKILVRKLLEIEASILVVRGPSDNALETVGLSKKLRGALSQQGKANGAWASFVRNGINYRQEFKVWYPSKPQQGIVSGLHGRQLRWQPWHPLGFDLSAGDTSLIAFTDVCNVISRMLTAILKDVANRSPVRRSCFVEKTAFKYLKHKAVQI